MSLQSAAIVVPASTHENTTTEKLLEHMAATDRVAGHHGHHGLRGAPDLDLEVEHVEPADAVGTEVMPESGTFCT